MNLVDDNYSGKKSNKKIFMACGIGIVVLLLIVIILAVCATVLNSGMKLVIDSKKAKTSYLWKDGDNYYVQVEALATTQNGYSYKTGNPDIPDLEGCYLTNTAETTVFRVNSNQIYKITRMEDDSQEIAYYDMDNPAKVRDTDNKIYIPVTAVSIAANASCTVTDKQITITSIGYNEAYYNREVKSSKNSNFTPDSAIKWDVSYSNKKLLRDNLVIIKDNDNENLLGIAKVKADVSGKGKKQKLIVTHTEILSPRYKSIEYNEKFDQLVVETDDGKGIIQLVRDGSNIKPKTVVTPQYEDIKPINTDLYLVAEKRMIESTKIDNKTGEKKQEYVIKYGIINKDQDQVLPTEYDYIGVENAYQYTNNSMKDEFIILDKYIPVKRDDLWGLVDLEGKIILKPTYDSLGCAETNASSNVFIIPEIDAFIYKRNSKYGVSYFTGEIIVKNVATRIYIDTTKEQTRYNMIWKDQTHDLLALIEENQYMTSITTNLNNTTNTTNSTNNTTNTTNNTTNKTNNTTSNTTNTTNNTTSNTVNRINATNNTNNTTNNATNNTTNKTNNSTVVIVNPTL